MIVASRVLSLFIFLCMVSCTWDQLTPKVDCTTSPVELILNESSPTSCGAAVGSFTVDATGGEPPYIFSSKEMNSTNGAFQNLTAGTYSVVATDVLGCTSQLEVQIQNQGGVNLQDITVTQTSCGSSDGSIQLAVSGGVEPYLFSIDGNDLQQSNSFTSLGNGSYTIRIQDQTGCELIESVEILSEVSYENSIKNLIKNRCSGCHASFTNYNTLKAKAASVKSRTGNGSMPQGSTLSQEQIDMIACWVDDGAVQN